MMDVWVSVLFSALVLAASVGLMVWNVRAWRLAQAETQDAMELDYRRRQFRRRIQTSAMLGVLGLGILGGRLLMLLPVPPTVLVVVWAGVLLLLAWIGLLAAVDIAATTHYFRRLRQHFLVEETKLHAQLRRLKSGKQNGKSTAGHAGKNGASGSNGKQGRPPEAGH